MKFAAALLLALPGLAAGDVVTPADLPEYCFGDFELQVTDLTFSYSNTIGGTNVKNNGELLEWGTVFSDWGQSGLLTQETAVATPVTVAFDGNQFQIGSLTHFNKPILLGTALTGVDLGVTVHTNAGNFFFQYQLKVEETPNNIRDGPCPYPGTTYCSDAVWILNDPTPQRAYTTTLSGKKFTFEIDLLGFRDEPNEATVTKFFSDERSSNTAYLYAGLVLVGCPPPVNTGGDPHFMTWTGTYYDFHGACDLHLVDAPAFANGMDLLIDVRTKIRDAYSYIESAVLMIGEETFEVSSWGEYVLNGVDNAELPGTISGFPINYTVSNKKVHEFVITISETEKITLKTFKDMVSVIVDDTDRARFGGATGMMGDPHVGQVYTRDGLKILVDPEEIAREWQVRDTEPMLFSTVNGRQFPEGCEMPSPAVMKARRLGNKVNIKAAEEACANWPAGARDGCVRDVMQTGDLEFAAAGLV